MSPETIRKWVKTHFGRIFEICSIKGDELPEGHPDRKWKGRSVFQGNRVSDEHNDYAIFSELGSSPALMEAAKVGSQPGYTLSNKLTRSRLTRKRCSKALKHGSDSHATDGPKNGRAFKIQLSLLCWLFMVITIQVVLVSGKSTVRINLGLWAGHLFFRRSGNRFSIMPKLDLLIVIYVDDLKMAGPSKNLDKGWKAIESVVDVYPPEPFGRYFGCNHVEKTQVKPPRSAHPFAYVFDKKTAAPARGDPRPQAREDYWEVDTELGAVVRHHVPQEKVVHPYQS